MSNFYIKLTNGLEGYYVKVSATDEESVVNFATCNFGHMWAGVVSEGYLYEIERKRSTVRIVNRGQPIILSQGTWMRRESVTGMYIYSCSNCLFETDGNRLWPYCPHCGRRMVTLDE